MQATGFGLTSAPRTRVRWPAEMHRIPALFRALVCVALLLGTTVLYSLALLLMCC